MKKISLQSCSFLSGGSESQEPYCLDSSDQSSLLLSNAALSFCAAEFCFKNNMRRFGYAAAGIGFVEAYIGMMLLFKNHAHSQVD